MRPSQNPAWVELVQLVPVVSFALPFVLSGEVDLSQADSGFLLGAVLFVVVTGLVAAKKHVLNPILIGTGLWLVVGAVAFSIPVPPLAAWLVSVQALALFLGAAAVGVVTTFGSPYGYIGGRAANRAWVRKSSLALLLLTVAALGWAWVFRGDVRVGGGLPFIVLNVARRVILRRAPRAEAEPA
jgi:hypothetical protein